MEILGTEGQKIPINWKNSPKNSIKCKNKFKGMCKCLFECLTVCLFSVYKNPSHITERKDSVARRHFFLYKNLRTGLADVIVKVETGLLTCLSNQWSVGFR